MDVVTIVGVTAALFVIISLSEPLAEWSRLPYTVVLAVLGIFLGASAILLLEYAPGVLGPAIAAEIFDFRIRANVFLYVLLPTLLFQVSLGLNLRRMADDWVPILVMAVLAVVVATFTIGFALAPFTAMPLVACLMLGAIVATTDPSAVVSIFRNIAAPQRLTRIVEGESLLNDAAAIALFGFFLTFVMLGVPNPTLQDALVGFPALILGGLATGWILARICVGLFASLGAYPLAQVSLSMALPYVAYLLADRILGVSGVTAVVMAGVTLNLLAPGRMSPAHWAYLREVWDVLAHWAGALIFLLAALLVPRLLGDMQLRDLALIGVVTAAAIAARLIMLYGVLPVLTAMRLSPTIERPYRVAILWGGLRGAVTLALALAVIENARVPLEIKREVGILATGFTLFTLLIQGTTLRWVIALLGLDKLSPLDRALSNQVIAVALENVREEVANTVHRHELSHDIVRSEAKRFAERLDTAMEKAEGDEQIPDRDRITLGLVALAGRERDMILEAFREQLISPRLAEQMVSDADRLIERTRSGGRDEYRTTGRLRMARGLPGRRLPAQPLTLVRPARADDGGSLRNRTQSEADPARLAPLHRRQDQAGPQPPHCRPAPRTRPATGTGSAIGSRRAAAAVSRLCRGNRTALHPAHLAAARATRVRRIVRGWPDRPRTLYDAPAGTGRAEAASGDAPPLDLTVQKDEFVRQFPLFADMDDNSRGQLARALKTRYVQPGDNLMRKGDTPREVCFIASGAFEVETAGQKQKLGRGEMFGQLSILSRQTRRTQVIAISHSTLLVLDETRFRRLLARNAAVRDAVRRSAERRGLDVDLLEMTQA